MSDKDQINLLQSSINFYQQSLKDWERALSYLKPDNEYYMIIVEKMLEESDLVDKYNKMIKNKIQTR